VEKIEGRKEGRKRAEVGGETKKSKKKKKGLKKMVDRGSQRVPVNRTREASFHSATLRAIN